MEASLLLDPPANGNDESNVKKIPILPESKPNGNNISLICYSETFLCRIKLSQALWKRIFQGSLTLLAYFEFATSCQKIKVWYMHSNGIRFL